MVQRGDIEKAFRIIRERGFSPNRSSTKWDIIDPETRERFPPKAVLRIAMEEAGEVPRSLGGGWPTNDPLRAMGFEIVLKPHVEKSDEATDIADILGAQADETTKRRLINARLGQGGFRENLLEMWGCQCPVTGCRISVALRASHIRAWRACDNNQRLDPYNGLLLVASVDALFDKHLLTFTPSGSILLAASLDHESVCMLGLKPAARVDLSERHLSYMEWHRAESERMISQGLKAF